MEVIASRSFSGLFIGLDIVFLLTLVGIMLYTKRYLALIVGLLGGLLYFAVDYGIFLHALGTRQVVGGSAFWVLLWMSLSYGFTNMAWVWLWLDRDKKTLEWSLLIIAGWVCVALLDKGLGANLPHIQTVRGTIGYHGFMALAMFVGYAILIVKNIKKDAGVPIPWILAIGLLVQFAWEAVLLIAGIRSIQTAPIIINSLIETNMGLPYLYFIHKAVTSRRNEDLTLKQM